MRLMSFLNRSAMRQLAVLFNDIPSSSSHTYITREKAVVLKEEQNRAYFHKQQPLRLISALPSQRAIALLFFAGELLAYVHTLVQYPHNLNELTRHSIEH